MSLTSKPRGPHAIENAEHQLDSNSKKVTSPVLIPGTVIPPATDISAGPVQVGKGSMLRIRVTASTYIAFGDSTLGAVSATTSPGLELNTAGVYVVTATDNFIRASANPARIEIIPG